MTVSPHVDWTLSTDRRSLRAFARPPRPYVSSSPYGRLSAIACSTTGSSDDTTPVVPPSTGGQALTYGADETPSYPTPAATTFYVDGLRGSDANDGKSAPWKTIDKAASSAPSGASAANPTIVCVRGGTYYVGRTRETGSNNGSVAVAFSQANLTLQNYPGEKVRFVGWSTLDAASFTQVTFTKTDGSTGTAWRRTWTAFRRDMQYSWNTDAAYETARQADNYAPLDGKDPNGNTSQDKYWQFVDYINFPTAHWPERVKYDGVQLPNSVRTLDKLTAGRFYVDAKNGYLYVGSTPTGHTVELTTLQTCLNFLGANAVFRGIEVDGYATSNPQGGAVKFHRPNPTAENVIVRNVSAGGILMVGSANGIGAHDFSLTRMLFQNVGNLSVRIDKCDRGEIRGSRFSYSNDKRYQYAPSAGGVKATYYRGLTIAENLFEDTFGKHVWADDDCWDTSILRNIFRRCYQRGMVLEISDRALVAGNLFDQCGTDALAPVDFAGFRIWNNTFMRSGWRRNQPDTGITDTFANPRHLNFILDNRRPRGNGNADYGIDSRTRTVQAAGTPYAGDVYPPYPADPGWQPRNPTSSGDPQEIRNNIFVFGNVQAYLAVEDYLKNSGTNGLAESAETLGIAPDYNLYQRDPSTAMEYPWTLQNTGKSNSSYQTITALRARGMEAHGIELGGSTRCVDDAGQLISAQASLHAQACPLPADVAAALGQPTGTKRFGAFPFVTTGGAAAGDPNLTVWTARASSATNAQPRMIAVKGDSISYGAASDGSSSPKWQKSWPGRLRDALAAAYGDAGTGLVIANNNTNGQRPNPAYDPRWSFVGTITPAAGTTDKGYHRLGVYNLAAGAGNYVEFVTTCTSFRTHVISGSAGVQMVSVDGGTPYALRNVAGAGTPDLAPLSGGHAKHIVTEIPAGQLGVHTLRVWGSGGDVALFGVEGRTGNGRFIVSNPSISGKSLGSFMTSDETNGQYGLPLLDTLRADLLVEALVANDWQGSTAVATLQGYLNTIITRQRNTGGDVLLWVPPIPSPSLQPSGGPTWDDLRAGWAAVGANRGVTVVDHSYLLGASWSAANAAGYYSNSTIHPNDNGAAKIAAEFRPYLGI